MAELWARAHIAWRNAMTCDDDFHVKLGRIRSRRAQRARPFIVQAFVAAEKAGGRHRRDASSSRRSTFGRGRAANLSAARLLGDRSRKVTIKARIVRQTTRGAPLAAHLSYLRRDGVTGTALRGGCSMPQEMKLTIAPSRSDVAVTVTISGSSRLRRTWPISATSRPYA